MSPVRALRLALARAADDVFGLVLSVVSSDAAEAARSATIAAFSEDRLIVVLDGPQGSVGAVSVDLAFLAGLIEMQTMGQVLAREAEARPPTRTDAALAAPLIDAVLAAFAGAFEGDGHMGWTRGYRFGAMVDGPRMLGLLLEAPDFHLFRLQADLGEGAKTGELVIALPMATADEEVEPRAGAQGDAAGDRCLGEGALMQAEASLRAVLHRARLPLSKIAGLKPGDRLNIPRGALMEARLEAGGQREIASCRLGQVNGFRAVRMVAGPDPAGEATAERAGQDRQAGKPPQLTDGRGLPERFERPETGIGVTGQPDSLAEIQDPRDLGAPGPEAVMETFTAPPPDALPDIGDLSDLPELALDE